MQPPIISFYDNDDITVHLTQSDDTTLVIFGVEGERAVVMPLTVFLHLVGKADDECAKAAILLHESMNQTKH
jgi:hypothetical protein